MADESLLARAAAAMVDVLARQREVQAGLALVQALEQEGGEPVSGERSFFEGLAARIDEACRRLHDHPDDSGIGALESLLAEVDWDLAPTLTSELERRHGAQQAAVADAASRLRGWDVRLNELANIVNGARWAGAPFAALEEELKSADRRLAQLRSALADRLYGQLLAQCETASQAMQSLDATVAEASARIGRVKELVRQADLLIMNTGAADGAYVYRVLLRRADRAATGGISIIQEIRELSPADRDDFLLGGFERLGAALLPGPDGTPPPPVDIAAQLRMLGRFMGKMLISERMRDVLWNEDWSFSITSNDLQLPWELIGLEPPATSDTEDERVLCLTRPVSRMPLGDTFPKSRRGRRSASGRRRMLLIHSDPQGTLRAAADEVDTIARELAEVLDIVRLDPDEATNRKLNEALSGDAPFDLIHYSGHAHFDDGDPSRSGLHLKDSLLDADKIRRLNRGGSLVFLNACESAEVGATGVVRTMPYLIGRPDPVVGLASAFIYSGALGCVGSLWPMYDRAAAQLAIAFYRFVLAGDPTGEALRRARADLREAYPHGHTWASYVLYGDPTFRLTEG